MADSPRRSALTGLLVVVVPFLLLIFAEITVLVWVSTAVGWWTLALMAGTTLLGAYLLQREWRKAWGGLADAIRTGSLPPGRTADAVLILVGGILLIVPGFVGDVVGLLLLLPFTRPWVRSSLGWWAGRALQKYTDRTQQDAGIVSGEVVEDDDNTIVPRISPHRGGA